MELIEFFNMIVDKLKAIFTRNDKNIELENVDGEHYLDSFGRPIDDNI